MPSPDTEETRDVQVGLAIGERALKRGCLVGVCEIGNIGETYDEVTRTVLVAV